MLKGNFDNYTGKDFNITRWDSIKSQLLSKGSKVTLLELKEVAAYHEGKAPSPIQEGNLYNELTQQIISPQCNISLQWYHSGSDG